MKKLIPGLLILAFFGIGSSCKKEEKKVEPTFEERLEGSWNLKSVKYKSEVPSPTGGDPIPVEGTGTDVTGSINLSRNPHLFDYNFGFTANANIMGFPLSLPIQQGGTGTWTTTSDNSKIITTDDNGDEVVFNVKVNEATRQVYETTVTQSLQGFALSVDLELEFQKQ